MNVDEKIQINLNIIRSEGRRGVFFGTSYIQRLCKIGYNQALHTIKYGLSNGVLETNPNNEWEYSIFEQD